MERRTSAALMPMARCGWFNKRVIWHYIVDLRKGGEDKMANKKTSKKTTKKPVKK